MLFPLCSYLYHKRRNGDALGVLMLELIGHDAYMVKNAGTGPRWHGCPYELVWSRGAWVQDSYRGVCISPLLCPPAPHQALAKWAIPHAFPARALAPAGLLLIPQVPPAFNELFLNLSAGDFPHLSSCNTWPVPLLWLVPRLLYGPPRWVLLQTPDKNLHTLVLPKCVMSEPMVEWTERWAPDTQGHLVLSLVGGCLQDMIWGAQGPLSLNRMLPPSIGSDFPGGSDGKESTSNAGDPGSTPVSRRSPGEGNGTPLQCSCLENPMDGGAWWATVHGVAKSWTRLSDFTYIYI